MHDGAGAPAGAVRVRVTRRRRWFPSRVVAGCLLLLSVAAGCRGREPDATPPAGEAMQPIREVIEAETPTILKIPGVVGIYEGETRRHVPCIRVMVVKRTRELEEKIPKRLGGHPVEIEETGVIRPMR